VEASLPARVLRAAQAPIQHCFLTESVFDIGMGTLILARGATRHHLALSSFLIDVFYVGIKDVIFESVDNEVFEMYMEATDAGSPMISVDPSYARKLMRDLASWSQSIGFAPHRDFAAVERMFGDTSAEASDAVFRFGRDGKPMYIPGRTTPLPSFSGGSRNCGSISAMTVSRRRPEADPMLSPVRRSTRRAESMVVSSGSNHARRHRIVDLRKISSGGFNVLSRAKSSRLRTGSITRRSPSRCMIASSPGSSNSTGMRTAWLRPLRNNLTPLHGHRLPPSIRHKHVPQMRPLTRGRLRKFAALRCPVRRKTSLQVRSSLSTALVAGLFSRAMLSSDQLLEP
jgi:hypothetical protein